MRAKFILPGNAFTRPTIAHNERPKPVPGLKHPPSPYEFSAAYSVSFDKAAFPKRRDAAEWVKMNGKAHGVRMASMTSAGDAWNMRQGSSEPPTGRKIVAPGVYANICRMTKGNPFPVMAQVGAGVNRGASGIGIKTPEMPNFYAIHFSPEAEKRQAVEAKQSENRRRSGYRDFSTTGMHGTPPAAGPVRRYKPGETATADLASRANREFLTSDEIKQHRRRIKRGLTIGYDTLQSGKPRGKNKT